MSPGSSGRVGGRGADTFGGKEGFSLGFYLRAGRGPGERRAGGLEGRRRRPQPSARSDGPSRSRRRTCGGGAPLPAPRAKPRPASDLGASARVELPAWRSALSRAGEKLPYALSLLRDLLGKSLRAPGAGRHSLGGTRGRDTC